MPEEDEDLWCTKCGSKDPAHLALVQKYMGCNRDYFNALPSAE